MTPNEPLRQDSEAPEKKQDPLVVKRNREGTWFALFFVAGVLFSTFSLPIKMVAGIFAILALVWAVRFFIAGFKAKQVGAWIAMGIVGVMGAGYILLGSIGTIVLWPLQSEYENCVDTAITGQAALECTSDYQQGLEDWFEDFTGVPYPGTEAK